MIKKLQDVFYNENGVNDDGTLSNTYKTFLFWCLLAGLIFAAIYIVWDLGLLQQIVIADVTYICVVIICLFVIFSGHCAYISWFLSRQDRMLAMLAESIRCNNKFPARLFVPGKSFAEDYLVAIQSQSQEKQDTMVLTETMAESFRAPSKAGWFVAGVVIKLGLLGTVIGFVLMLGSISDLENLDISDIKDLMGKMTQGMGVSMNTTIVGLLANILLGLQYSLIDRGTDQLIGGTIQLSQELTSVAKDKE